MPRNASVRARSFAADHRSAYSHQTLHTKKTINAVAAPRSNSAPRFRETEFADYAGIMSLLARHGLSTPGIEQWKYLWLGNPSYTRQCPLGWVMEVDDKLVGYFGNIPLAYELEGQQVRAASGRGWAVDQDYRSFSLYLLHAFFSQSETDLLLNTTANVRGEAAFCSLGGVPAPNEINQESAFWITDATGFSELFLRRKGVPFHSVLKYPVAAAASVLQHIRQGAPGKMQVERFAGFDENFDRFWNKLRNEKRAVLLGRRDRATLAWHFHYALKKNNCWIFGVVQGRELLAYAVFDRTQHRELGLQRMRLVDYQSLADLQPLAAIISLAIRCAKKAGIHMVEVAGCRIEARVKKELAPFTRPIRATCLYRAPYKALAAQLANPARWDTSLYDGDSSL